MKRVAITGIGVVSPVGIGLEEFWHALIEGRSGIGPIKSIATDRLNVRTAAEVKDFQPELHFDKRAAAKLDRFAQFSVIAARNAVADAGVVFDEALARTTATIVGTGVGGQHSQDDAYFRLYGQNASRLHPFTIPRLMINAGASQVSMDLG
jgi:nodulation protein E